MVKKKTNFADALELESKVAPILDITYSDPLFSFAAHPTRPIIVAGLATGHLYSHSYNAEELEDKVAAAREKTEGKKAGKPSAISQLKNKWWTVEPDHANILGNNGVTANWKTKRHKGSCRSVVFDVLEGSAGDHIYSVGTDHIIKKAATETGKVVSKSEIVNHYSDPKDAVTTMNISPTHPFLVTGTENGDMLVFDSNNLSNKLKFKLNSVHDDAVAKILPMPAVSAYHYLTLGSTTLSHVDIRKGIITQSDDQSDELLSMCYATDHVNDNKNDTVLVSHGEGIVTLWRNSTNRLMDQISRVKVNKNASIDAIVPTMNAGDEDLVNCVWCGDSEGLLHRVDYKKGKVVETRVHSSVIGKRGGTDEVACLDIDYDYRLMSAGMENLKIWSGQGQEAQEISEDEDDSDSDNSDNSDSDSFGSGSGSDSEEELELEKADEKDSDEDIADEVSEEEADSDSESVPAPALVKRSRLDVLQPTKKKTKINLNKVAREEESEDEQPKKKLKKQQIKKQPDNGIAKFDGL